MLQEPYIRLLRSNVMFESVEFSCSFDIFSNYIVQYRTDERYGILTSASFME